VVRSIDLLPHAGALELGGDSELAQTIRLGKWLEKHRDQVIDGGELTASALEAAASSGVWWMLLEAQSTLPVLNLKNCEGLSGVVDVRGVSHGMKKRKESASLLSSGKDRRRTPPTPTTPPMREKHAGPGGTVTR
jgi:hypothetical protein